jgi:hypothetical protein
MNHIRRVPAVLATLAGVLLALTAAPAALASPPPLGPNRAGYPPVTAPVHIHTVVTGGMPGWQITLITAGAALLAAALAVLLDRARATRRHITAPTA